MNEDITQWDSAQLTKAILQADKSNMSRVREMIFQAEDTDFTIEESAQLSPWLLNFAEKHLYLRYDGSDYDHAINSAIRTGASMLFPKDASNLLPLLQPGCCTTLVAMKMMGRIFEAQPPTDIDQHIDLANDILQILNRHVIATQSSSEVPPAAYTILTIRAIITMGGSSTIDRIVEIIQGYDAWAIKRLYHKLNELREVWWEKGSVSENIMEFLGQVIGDIYLVIAE
jgi:hypothetical protein